MASLDVFSGQDFSSAFRITNLAVAGLAVWIERLVAIIQRIFLRGLFLILFGAVVGLLEFQIPAEARVFGSFLFSFIGRGVFYILLSVLIDISSWFRGIAAFLLFVVGVVYAILDNVTSVAPPDNMSMEGGAIGIDDDEVI